MSAISQLGGLQLGSGQLGAVGGGTSGTGNFSVALVWSAVPSYLVLASATFNVPMVWVADSTIPVFAFGIFSVPQVWSASPGATALAGGIFVPAVLFWLPFVGNPEAESTFRATMPKSWPRGAMPVSFVRRFEKFTSPIRPNLQESNGTVPYISG